MKESLGLKNCQRIASQLYLIRYILTMTWSTTTVLSNKEWLILRLAKRDLLKAPKMSRACVLGLNSYINMTHAEYSHIDVCIDLEVDGILVDSSYLTDVV